MVAAAFGSPTKAMKSAVRSCMSRHLHPRERQIAEHLVVDQRDTGRSRGLR